jgi:hypothetical protein
MFKTRIQGRKAANVASAANIKIGNGTSASITGTTTIHTIYTLNWYDGALLLLYFSDALSLKHQGTTAVGYARLWLEGGVDASMAAGSLMLLWYDGTNWQEVSRRGA